MHNDETLDSGTVRCRHLDEGNDRTDPVNGGYYCRKCKIWKQRGRRRQSRPRENMIEEYLGIYVLHTVDTWKSKNMEQRSEMLNDMCSSRKRGAAFENT